MKRILHLLLIIGLILCLFSCKQKANAPSTSQSDISSYLSSETNSQNSSVQSNSSIIQSSKTISSSSKTNVTSNTVVKEKSIYTIYDEADKKTEALKSIEYDYMEETTYLIDDKEQKTKKVCNIKEAQKDGKKIFRTNGTLTTPDENGVSTDYQSEFVYDGSNYYAIKSTGIIKATLEQFTIFCPDVNNEKNNDMPEITEADVISSIKGTYSDGITFTMKIKSDIFKTYLLNSMKDQNIKEEDLNISDFEDVGKIDNNGYIFSETATINMTITISSKTVSASIIMKRDIKNAGKTVTVDIPSNLPA